MVPELRPTVELAAEAEAVAQSVIVELGVLVPEAQVEHVGATAFPDGWTKGDVDLSVTTARRHLAAVVARLRRHYDVAQPENWTPTFASFTVPGRTLPVGLQVAVEGTASDFLVALRDLFADRPDLRRRYDDVKRSAAGGGPEAYWAAKDAFLTDLLAEHLPASAPALDAARATERRAPPVDHDHPGGTGARGRDQDQAR